MARIGETALQWTVLPLDLKTNTTVCRLFGFLLGSSLAAYGTYYYILDEYRMSNELLTEDIYVRTTIYPQRTLVTFLVRKRREE
jgi:hypothetical protein